jgi:hypothetical protein
MSGCWRASHRWSLTTGPIRELDDAMKAGWAAVDTHDALTDRYKHCRSVGSVRRTLEHLGADDIAVVRGGNGIEARARRR